ncbi:MAG: hypothetical protein QM747_20645 [Nocardioides sp.]
MVTQPELLPERAVLVHIGPYKTGTTAIQTSLHEHRDDLVAHGITYPGRFHRQMRPSWALLGRSRVGEARVPIGEWDAMADEVRAAEGRVVISSEDFASARPQHVRRLVEDLGADRVHVLVVARRLDKLLPSAWQERVKSVNETRTYDAWLREVLGPERDGGAARTFWHNHGLQSPDPALGGRAAARAGHRRRQRRGRPPTPGGHLRVATGPARGLPDAGAPHQHLPVDGAHRAVSSGERRGAGP